MSLEIGTYEYKEDSNEIALAFAIIRSISSKDGIAIFTIKVGNGYSDEYYFDMDRNSENLRHYKNLLEYFSFSNYKGKMKYDGSIFTEKQFTEFYKPLKIISDGKMIEVGKVYFDSNRNKVFVLGVVKTSINESEHTIIVRKITDGKFNDRIDYDHDQLAATPDFRDCFFFDRGSFLEKYKK
jgi:hypothetical protein